MPGLSQMEFNAIREVSGCHIVSACKLGEYAEKCTDGQIKQMLSKASQDAGKSAQTLANML